MNFIFKPLWSILVALVMLVVGAVDPDLDNVRDDNFISESVHALDQALFRSQDVTNDGEHYYFSSSFTLYKTTLDGEVVAKNLLAIPGELLLKGLNHIGGISYCNGKIYAAVESNPGFKYSYIVVYDAQTLKATGQWLELPSEDFVSGIAWLTADAQRGVIYCLESYRTCVLNAYNIDDLSFSHSVDLSFKRFSWIQGGEMYEGKLYLSLNSQNTPLKEIWSVDVETGECSMEFQRNVGNAKIEAEGLTILDTGDGALFHVIDLGLLKVSAYFRHYSF